MATVDSNGTVLNSGDSARTTKDLKVKGFSKTLKRGEIIKNIRTTSNDAEIECRIGKSTIVIKTCFLKKV